MGFKAHYARQHSAGWPVDSWAAGNHLLGYLDPDKRAYASFTLADGSYVQCAGAKRRLTVEARLVGRDGDFVHYVFGRGEPTGATEVIECSIGPIAVDETQVLDMRAARQIIRAFVEDRVLHPSFVASDVTVRFSGSSRDL